MPIDHIFDQLDIRAEPFAICEIHGTCRVALKSDSAVTLHYILSGDGRITMRNQPPMEIATGSLLLVPSLNSHEVLNNGATVVPGPACKPAALNLAHILKRAPSDGPSVSRLVALCAHVNIGLLGATDVVNLIREPLMVDTAEGSEMNILVHALMRELSEPRVGSRALIRALLLQAVIGMMRDQVAAGESTMDWMKALRDPKIWKAMNAMMDNPGKPYSVESLADIAGLSRAAFARRFVDAYGTGPMELLRELRVRKAGDLLRTSDLPVKRVAAVVGFASRSAFSRAFEEIAGQSPSAFRKAGREA